MEMKAGRKTLLVNYSTINTICYLHYPLPFLHVLHAMAACFLYLLPHTPLPFTHDCSIMPTLCSLLIDCDDSEREAGK